MTYEQLMDHAQEIEQLAQREAMELRISGAPAQRWMLSGSYRSQFDGIGDLFQPFADMPDPAKFAPMINAVDKVLERLSPGYLQDPSHLPTGGIANRNLSIIASVSSCLESWTGRAAMEFKSLFVDPFPALVANQFIIAVALRWALAAHREVWMRARNDIDTIAHKTIAALERMDDCGKNEWTITFTAFAAVAAVAALPLAGGALVAITIAGGIAEVEAVTFPDDPPTTGFSGESAEAVIGEMREAVGFLATCVREQETTICRVLDSARATINHDRANFASRRPALADATPATVTGPEYMGYSY